MADTAARYRILINPHPVSSSFFLTRRSAIAVKKTERSIGLGLIALNEIIAKIRLPDFTDNSSQNFNSAALRPVCRAFQGARCKATRLVVNPTTLAVHCGTPGMSQIYHDLNYCFLTETNNVTRQSQLVISPQPVI
jgi:hypothetical protein